jgi:segregation and condensation protein B
MDETQIKHVLEAALLAAGRPLTLERLAELLSAKGAAVERATVKKALDTLASDYEGRGIELKEVASGYRVQIKRSMSDWLMPLWEERAPRYTRALLETLALIAYRQPITRGEIEEVRGVVVSTNIIRTLLERNWVRVVGYRDVPGKPAMLGTTREFLDYFGLKKLEDLPPLSEIKDGLPELSPQTDLVLSLEAEARLLEGGVEDDGNDAPTSPAPLAEFEDADANAERGSVIPLRAVQRGDGVE